MLALNQTMRDQQPEVATFDEDEDETLQGQMQSRRSRAARSFGQMAMPRETSRDVQHRKAVSMHVEHAQRGWRQQSGARNLAAVI